MHVTGVQVQLTGLTPATGYNIYIHSLPHNGESTDYILVRTLAQGAAEVAVTPADYEGCG